MQHKRIVAHKKTIVPHHPVLGTAKPTPYVGPNRTMQSPNTGAGSDMDELGDYDPDGLGGADTGGGDMQG